MATRAERESLRVVATREIDSDFHAVLLRISFPPSWRADSSNGGERDPIPTRFETRERYLKGGEYAGGIVGALGGMGGGYILASVSVLPVLFAAGVIIGVAQSKKTCSKTCSKPNDEESAKDSSSQSVPQLGSVPEFGAPSHIVAAGGVVGGGAGMAVGVQLLSTLGGAAVGLQAATPMGLNSALVGSFMGSMGSMGTLVVPASASIASVQTVPGFTSLSAEAFGDASAGTSLSTAAIGSATILSAVAGAVAGRMIGKKATQMYLEANGDPEKERLIFLQLVERNQMERFFDAQYLKGKIWDLPDSYERKKKLWFDMALLPRLASTEATLTYIGTFQSGKMHGQGMLIVSGTNKPVFFGNFCDGYPHGKAVVLRDFKAVAELHFNHGVVKQFQSLNRDRADNYLFQEDSRTAFNFVSSKCSALSTFFSGDEESEPIDRFSSVVFDDASKKVKPTADGLRDVAEDAYARAVEFVSEKQKVYVSYVRNTQRQSARKLVQQLRENHGENMTFEHGVVGVENVENSVNSSGVVIVLLCDKYLKDVVCIQELVTAQRQNRVVIPITVRNNFSYEQFESLELSYYDVANSLSSDKWTLLLQMNILPIDVMSATEFLLRRKSISTDVNFAGGEFEDELAIVSKYIRRAFANI